MLLQITDEQLFAEFDLRHSFSIFLMKCSLEILDFLQGLSLFWEEILYFEMF